MAGTFWGQKSLKVLSNKVFRFIQPTLFKEQPPPWWAAGVSNSDSRPQKLDEKHHNKESLRKKDVSDNIFLAFFTI